MDKTKENRFKALVIKYRLFIIVITHILLVIAAYLFSFYIRFEGPPPNHVMPVIYRSVLGLVIIKVLVYWAFGLFAGLWRYVSMEDLWAIVKANVTATFVFSLYMVFGVGLEAFPRSVFLLDWLLCSAFMGGIRFLNRAIKEKISCQKHSKKQINAIIIGAGEAGLLVLKELNNNMDFNIIGFIDDDPMKKGRRIHGKKIFGGLDVLEKKIGKYNIQQLILAIPSAKGQMIRDIVSRCIFPDVKLQIVPGLYQLIGGQLETKLRDVRPEDLLGRKSVKVNDNEIGGYIAGKRVLVTGGAGSIGSELVRQIIKFNPKELTVLDYNENDLYFLQREFQDKKIHLNMQPVTADLKDRNALKNVFETFMPEVVFHAAAFKHVPLMERNPESAVKNNVICSQNLIDMADHYKVERFVLISSDKAVNPTNIMGATKRIVEMLICLKASKSKTKFMAVRFGNVLGSNGSVIPLFKKQIKEDRKVTITHPEVTRFFMSTQEAVLLVLQAGAIGIGGEIFVLDMGEQIKIMDLAKNLIKLSGLEVDDDVKIEIVGLRPGEKLYEEVIHDAESDLVTKNEKIFIIKNENMVNNDLLKKIKELGALSEQKDKKKIISKIQEIVPTYTPFKN